MDKDILLLLPAKFEVPDRPGGFFSCPYCMVIDGLLSAFPHLAVNLQVERADWLRPRAAAIALAGQDNQTLPLLIFARGSLVPYRDGIHDGREFVSEQAKIFRALSERHSFPTML
jgi:Protein of unknown function (DUF3088)